MGHIITKTKKLVKTASLNFLKGNRMKNQTVKFYRKIVLAQSNKFLMMFLNKCI